MTTREKLNVCIEGSDPKCVRLTSDDISMVFITTLCGTRATTRLQGTASEAELGYVLANTLQSIGNIQEEHPEAARVCAEALHKGATEWNTLKVTAESIKVAQSTATDDVDDDDDVDDVDDVDIQCVAAATPDEIDLVEYACKLTILDRENESLKDEVAGLEAKLATRYQEIANLEDNAVALEDRNINIAGENESLKDEVAGLEAKLYARYQEIANLEDNVVALEDRNINIAEQNRVLEKDKEDLHKMLRYFMSKTTQLEATITELHDSAAGRNY